MCLNEEWILKVGRGGSLKRVACASLAPFPAPRPTPRPAWWKEAVKDILAGTIGGFAGKLIEYPFDTIKVRLQASASGLGQRFTGPWDCFKRTLQAEGAYGLYKGMSFPLFGTVLETATLFLSNGSLRRALVERGHLKPGEDLPIPLVFLSGAGAGFFVSFVLTPLELVKCRLQVQVGGGSGEQQQQALGRRLYRGPFDCLRRSVKHEGLSVLYRGHVATLLREIPGTGCWFTAYELCVRSMMTPGQTRKDLHPGVIITAGALGGMAYWFVMYPSDTIKSAMQTAQPLLVQRGRTAQPGSDAAALRTQLAAAEGSPVPLVTRMNAAAVVPPPPTFRGTFAQIYGAGGLRGLYAGLAPTLMRAAPSNAAVFLVYEHAIQFMETWH